MAWVVTLRVTNCRTSSTIEGATIADGTVSYVTDVNGQFIAVIDDYWSDYIVSISKMHYHSKTFAMNKAKMAGTLQTVCLEPTFTGDQPPPPPPNGDGW